MDHRAEQRFPHGVRVGDTAGLTYLLMAVAGRVMQRRVVVATLHVDVGAALQQCLGDVVEAVVASLVQRRPACASAQNTRHVHTLHITACATPNATCTYLINAHGQKLLSKFSSCGVTATNWSE